jgi:radical SAM superfamily enzyme YgiQ (UPF0313 family)
MRVRIVVSYVPRYLRGHAWDFVPPVTGMHLAAITPGDHEVDLVHEQVRAVPVDGWPDLVALSFFSGFARRAYEVADAYRARGVRVVAGGPHASYWTEEALTHVDAVVVGEAESVWPEVLRDFERGTERRVYRGEPCAMQGLPTPRYVSSSRASSCRASSRRRGAAPSRAASARFPTSTPASASVPSTTS